MSTCYICKTQIELIQDGVNWCPCGSLGIDKTDHYVRYLGSIPAEDLSNEEKQKYDILINRFHAQEIQKCDVLINRQTQNN